MVSPSRILITERKEGRLVPLPRSSIGFTSVWSLRKNSYVCVRHLVRQLASGRARCEGVGTRRPKRTPHRLCGKDASSRFAETA